MGTDPVFTAIAFHGCGEVGCGRIAIRNGFMSYKLQSDRVIGLEVETIQASRKIRCSDDLPICVTLPAVLMILCAGVWQVNLETMQRYYNNYCVLTDKPVEAGGRGTAEGVDFDVLLGEHLM